MNIEPSEFKDLLWDIHNLDITVDLRQKFSIEFKQIFPSLVRKNREEANRLVRFIIYMYHVKTPLQQKIKNLDDRKMYASKLSGYTNRVGEDKTRKVLETKDVTMVEAICSFLEWHKNYDWAQLISSENLFWSYQKELMIVKTKKDQSITKAEIDRKKAIRAELKGLQEDINNLEYRIYSGDEDVIEVVTEVRKSLTFPEMIAV